MSLEAKMDMTCEYVIWLENYLSITIGLNCRSITRNARSQSGCPIDGNTRPYPGIELQRGQAHLTGHQINGIVEGGGKEGQENGSGSQPEPYGGRGDMAHYH